MPYGTVNADVISTSVANTSLGAGNATRFKNRIINGDMRINQRGASGTIVTGTYLADRWGFFQDTSATLTYTQSSVAPVGFINSSLITVTSAGTVTSGQGNTIRQSIEGLNVADLGWGTSDAKTVTLSFWVRSSVTGTFGGSITNSGNTRSNPFSYTISAANTWEQKTITIAGDTTGTWLTTNGIGITAWFSLGTGSTLSGTAGTWAGANYVSATGATNIVGTSGATWQFTGVQLEVGSSATGFEYVDYTTQLAMCQRYFFRRNFVSTTADYVTLLQAYATSAAYGKFCDLPVTMRTTPTGSLSAIGHFRADNAIAGGSAVFTGGSIDSLSPTTIGTTGMTGASGLVAGGATNISVNTTAAWIAASAEL